MPRLVLKENSFKRLKPIFRALSALNPIRALRHLIFSLRNRWRKRAKIDYVTLMLPGQIPALPEPRSWLQRRILGSPPLSLSDLNRMFERIGDDPRPTGVILHLRGLSMPLADLQSLRQSITRLREKGKRVICFAPSYSNATYFIASAADEIVLQPGGELETLGLRSQATFLRDALDRIGLQLDSVAISPYKGAFDQFTRSDISPEGRQQLEWLLDSQYSILVDAMAEGRRVSPEHIRQMIDSAPHLDQDALAAGYIDAVLTEEGLHRRLNAKHILPWQQADKKLLQKWRKPTERFVALLEVSGLMIPGESGRPPIDLPIPFIGGERAGDLTIVQQVRRLMKNRAAAAVILYINSGGGSASAAEAMTAALSELAQDRPLVAYFNNVAASGGYYIATPARWIVAQPGTITGSIGVLSGKFVSSGLYDQLHVHRLEFTRGANANLNSDLAPYTDAQRQRVLHSVRHIYQQFVAHVARSRGLTPEAVDAVGGGRVWTGIQAKEHGLVDELGDLRAAFNKARELAGLPDDAPLVRIGGKGAALPPQLAEAAKPAAALAYWMQNARMIASGAPQMLTPIDWQGV